MIHGARRVHGACASMLSLHRWFPVAALAVSCLAGCAPATADILAEEASAGDNALSGPIPAGSTLIATTDVNLRAGSTTSDHVIEVISSGASVTVIDANPQNGFYHVQHGSNTGWTYGAYYKVGSTPPPSGGTGGSGGSSGGSTDVTAADLLAVTANCQQLAGTTKFRTDAGGSSTVPICALTGAVWWRADMDIDCDGGRGATCQSDPDYQSDTATVDSKGNPLDASTLPYVVIPGSSDGFSYTAQGLKMGSVVAVIYKDKIAYGILGDVGPKGVIGEASYAMAVQLGINPSPISGGVDSGVTYVAFTGSSAVVSKKEDNSQAVQIGKAMAKTVVGSN